MRPTIIDTKHPWLRTCLVLAACAAVPIGASAKLPDAGPPPSVIQADPRVTVELGEAGLVQDGALQPFLLGTKGALVMQAQMPDLKPYPSAIPHYSYSIWTLISRDEGRTWARFPTKPGDNGGYFEGGMIQLRDGTILAFDTYVVSAGVEGEGKGRFYYSKDDWHTLEGPVEARYHLPEMEFSGGLDDQGHVKTAERLHRRIVELPNGDLLATLYCRLHGDNAPCLYMTTQYKTRVVLLRSSDRGRNWTLVSTVAGDLTVGTEGFTEAALERISGGPRAGRLICQMRTGQELREAVSDNEGRTWSTAQPRVFADLDVHRTEKWVDQFRGVRTRAGAGGGLDGKGSLIENNPVELVGAVADPDLLELPSGVLVAAFGVRVPPRACWPRAQFPWNGNYLAFSLDHGETWSHVIRLTSGVLTTHYMAIEKLPGENRLFVTYDLGDWRSHRGKAVYGRTVTVKIKS